MAVFFVGGSQRSGTTLLQTILCQDEAVNPLIREAKYLRRLVSTYWYGKRFFGDETQDYFRDLKQYVAFNRQIVRSFLKNTQSLFPNTLHLVLREPHLTSWFPQLHELLPDAMFVCIVRDPRDAVASLMEVGQKIPEKSKDRDVVGRILNSGDIKAIGDYYLSFYRPVLDANQAKFRRRLLILRYEDLVTEPETSVRSLREFTGIALENFDPYRDPDTGRVDYGKLADYRKAWAAETNAKGITRARIGRYAEVLSKTQVRELSEHLAGFMKRFDYS